MFIVSKNVNQLQGLKSKQWKNSNKLSKYSDKVYNNKHHSAGTVHNFLGKPTYFHIMQLTFPIVEY